MLLSGEILVLLINISAGLNAVDYLDVSAASSGKAENHMYLCRGNGAVIIAEGINGDINANVAVVDASLSPQITFRGRTAARAGGRSESS